MTPETVSQAIARSVSHNEIVTIGPFAAEAFVETRDALRGLSDDYVWTTTSRGPIVEFWGTDDDGDEWRVHLDASNVDADAEATDLEDDDICPRCGFPADNSSGHGTCDHPSHELGETVS